MRFVILRKADAHTEAGAAPSQELVSAMMQYNREMIDAGVMIGGDGLHPSEGGARIRFSRGRPSVVDGPFTEAKELVAGYTIIQAGSRDEALSWALRWPAVDGGGEVELELRQLYEADEFGEEFTPVIQEQAERLRARTSEVR